MLDNDDKSRVTLAVEVLLIFLQSVGISTARSNIDFVFVSVVKSIGARFTESVLFNTSSVPASSIDEGSTEIISSVICKPDGKFVNVGFKGTSFSGSTEIAASTVLKSRESKSVLISLPSASYKIISALTLRDELSVPSIFAAATTLEILDTSDCGPVIYMVFEDSVVDA